jgi:hypothetical protein
MEKWKTQPTDQNLEPPFRCFPLSHRLDYEDKNNQSPIKKVSTFNQDLTVPR